MRAAHHEELDAISDGLVEMANLVGSAIRLATTALLDADLQLAENVISADRKVDDLQRDLENRAIAVLARQQPGATDLRVVVTRCGMGHLLPAATAQLPHPAQSPLRVPAFDLHHPDIAALEQAANKGRYVDARHGSASARAGGQDDGDTDAEAARGWTAPQDIAAGIARLEGQLIWQAETRNAQAEAFADRIPWLTEGAADRPLHRGLWTCV
jgi:hypothetical protein